ncbi:CPBP family intramembrane glutamic endopeptidase [Mycolicibacterium thermoresistibile]
MSVAGENGNARASSDVRTALILGGVFGGVVAIWLLLDHGVAAVLGEDHSRTAHVVRALGATVLTVPLVVVARRRLDRRGWSGLGLTPLREGWRPLLLGIGWWAVPAAVATVGVVAAGGAQLRVQEPIGNVLAGLAALTVLVLLYEALPEELIFRGYFYANLAERRPVGVAVIGQAVLFTLWGVAIGAALSAERIVLFLVFSCALGVVRAITGSLWSTIGFHWAFQVTAQYLGPSWDAVALDDPDQLVVLTLSMVPFLAVFAGAAVLRRRSGRFRSA